MNNPLLHAWSAPLANRHVFGIVRIGWRYGERNGNEFIDDSPNAHHHRRIVTYATDPFMFCWATEHRLTGSARFRRVEMRAALSLATVQELVTTRSPARKAIRLYWDHA
jgi:hypothetical protein